MDVPGCIRHLQGASIDMSPGKGKGGKFPSDGFYLDMEGQGGKLRNIERIFEDRGKKRR